MHICSVTTVSSTKDGWNLILGTNVPKSYTLTIIILALVLILRICRKLEYIFIDKIVIFLQDLQYRNTLLLSLKKLRREIQGKETN